MPVNASAARDAIAHVLGNTHSSENKRQEWMDEKREAAFAEITEWFPQLYNLSTSHEAFRRWFVENLNSGLRLEGNRLLTMSDVSTLHLKIVSSSEASAVAGRPIKRPIMVFADRPQYFRFIEKITGAPCNSSAVHTKFIVDHDDGSNPIITTGLIFASRETGPDIQHEIHHSIDPYVHGRTGYDNMITEAFAFYDANINDDPRAYMKLLNNYFEEFTESAAQNEKKTLQSYETLVHAFVNKLHTLRKKLGDIETQRLLVQCRTLLEFFQKN